jgi:hypothetical protein
MPPEIYAAIIDEGFRVAAHIFHLEDAKSLLRHGLDVVAHSVRDKSVDQEFIDLMKKNCAGYIATPTGCAFLILPQQLVPPGPPK